MGSTAARCTRACDSGTLEICFLPEIDIAIRINNLIFFQKDQNKLSLVVITISHQSHYCASQPRVDAGTWTVPGAGVAMGVFFTVPGVFLLLAGTPR